MHRLATLEITDLTKPYKEVLQPMSFKPLPKASWSDRLLIVSGAFWLFMSAYASQVSLEAGLGFLFIPPILMLITAEIELGWLTGRKTQFEREQEEWWAKFEKEQEEWNSKFGSAKTAVECNRISLLEARVKLLEKKLSQILNSEIN